MTKTSNPNSSGPVLLFDGVCNTCNMVVSFLLAHDKHRRIKFASLQSSSGQKIARASGVDPQLLETVILVYEGKAYLRSEAIFKVLNLLGGGFRLFSALQVLPLPLRDRVYRAFAKNRYRLFGKKETCRVPTPDERDRFLD